MFYVYVQAATAGSVHIRGFDLSLTWARLYLALTHVTVPVPAISTARSKFEYYL